MASAVAASHLLVGSEQEGRVNVALQHAIRPDDLPRGRHVHGPVDREDVACHVALPLEIAAAAVGVVQDGHIGVCRAQRSAETPSAVMKE